MGHPGDILTASATEQALVERIALQEQQIADALAPYEPVSATLAWFETLRYIEECINLITVDWDDEEFEQELLRFPVTQMMLDPDRLVQLRRRVTARFSEKFCNRFGNLLAQGMAIGTGFAINGLFDVAGGFRTVGSMMGYLQSRRRHFVGLLQLLPKACRGNRQVHWLDTRIDRHEFDVVTVRDGVIWNVQCKNNFVDLARVDSDARRFARYNATLVRAYERALTKELNREHLLKLKLSLEAVQHMVVSRFPVISDNPRIIPFSRIDGFAALADSLSN